MDSAHDALETTSVVRHLLLLAFTSFHHPSAFLTVSSRNRYHNTPPRASSECHLIPRPRINDDLYAAPSFPCPKPFSDSLRSSRYPSIYTRSVNQNRLSMTPLPLRRITHIHCSVILSGNLRLGRLLRFLRMRRFGWQSMTRMEEVQDMYWKCFDQRSQ
jgi:hypothetical protein